MATETVLTFLDSYCERAGMAGAFAEPLNLVTNLFFIAAALISMRSILRNPSEGRQLDLWLLAGLMLAIGIGSGLWHLQPNGVTLMLDVLPITLFINVYIIAALRRLFELSWAKVGIWWAVYFVAGIIAQVTLPADLLNGTIMYIPTYLALAVMTVTLRQRDRDTGSIFALALGVWTVSLVFRTVDNEICPSLDLGTHFLWHTLNAWVLWRLLLVLIHDSGRITYQK